MLSMLFAAVLQDMEEQEVETTRLVEEAQASQQALELQLTEGSAVREQQEVALARARAQLEASLADSEQCRSAATRAVEEAKQATIGWKKQQQLLETAKLQHCDALTQLRDEFNAGRRQMEESRQQLEGEHAEAMGQLHRELASTQQELFSANETLAARTPKPPAADGGSSGRSSSSTAPPLSTGTAADEVAVVRAQYETQVRPYSLHRACVHGHLATVARRGALTMSIRIPLRL